MKKIIVSVALIISATSACMKRAHPDDLNKSIEEAITDHLKTKKAPTLDDLTHLIETKKSYEEISFLLTDLLVREKSAKMMAKLARESAFSVCKNEQLSIHDKLLVLNHIHSMIEIEKIKISNPSATIMKHVIELITIQRQHELNTCGEASIDQQLVPIELYAGHALIEAEKKENKTLINFFKKHDTENNRAEYLDWLKRKSHASNLFCL